MTTPTDGTGSTPSTDLAALLADRTFLSDTVEGYELVPGARLVLRFDGDRLGASGGCNQLGGTWSIDGDVLVVGEMMMTEMACEPVALMDQDAWVAEFLGAGPVVVLDGPTLTLTGPTGSVITFTDREVADPDRVLEDTSWTLQTLVTGDSASSVPAGVRTPTLAVVDGRLAVDTGCNRASALVEIGPTELVLGPLMTTRMACDEASMDVERQIVDVLEGTVAYAIEADQLTITRGDTALVFRAAD